MSDDIDAAEVRRRADLMRAMPEADRIAAIEAAGSIVIGFERFHVRAKQVQLRESYRRPVAPKPGGHA